jgi:hypothetical protein
MKSQLRRLGLGHDKRRSFATIDPEYYKWTQWIFLQIFNSWYDDEADKARPIAELIAQFETGERAVPGHTRAWPELSATERADVLGEFRLAYASDAPVNWCPGLGTVLANEEVTADGRSERGNFPVFKAKLRQWNMRITAYADRLLDDLDALDWPEAIKLQQRNWIGRSEGARVDFPVDGENITVFTTRPDTLFGATYMVLAPEHPLVDKFTPAAWPEGTHDVWTGGHATPAEAVAAYRAQAAQVRRRAAGRGQGQDRRLHRRVRDQPGQRRADPRLHRRLRADGLRHRRDHGRPGGRPARLRLRARLRAADHCIVEPTDGRGTDTSTWENAFGSYDAKIINSSTTTSPWTACPSPRPRRASPSGWPARASARAPSTSACATGCSAASATGASPSRSSTTRTASRTRCPSRCCPWSCRRSRTTRRAPSTRTTRTRPRDAPVPQRGLGRRHPGPGRRPRPPEVPPRDQHHAQLGRFLLVRTALPGPAQRPEAGRPGHRAVLDGPREGSRTAASTCTSAAPSTPYCTCCTRASGPRCCSTWGTSPPRAVPQAVQPGHDPGLRLPGQPRLPGAGRRGGGARRRLLLPGREGLPAAGQDGQVPEERGHSGRDLRRVRRRHAAPVRDGDGPAGRVAAVGHARGGGPVPAAAAAVAQRRRRGRPARSPSSTPSPTRTRCVPCTRRSTASARTWRACASTPPSPRSPS